MDCSLILIPQASLIKSMSGIFVHVKNQSDQEDEGAGKAYARIMNETEKRRGAGAGQLVGCVV